MQRSSNESILQAWTQYALTNDAEVTLSEYLSTWECPCQAQTI